MPPGSDDHLPSVGVRLRRQFGRRGSALVLIGTLWTLLGAGFALIPTERFSRPGQGGVLQFMDTQPWGAVIWVIGGVLAVLCGLTRKIRHRDDWGFNGLVLPVFIWMLAYLISFLANIGSNGAYGRASGILGALVFAGLGLLLLLIADWPDPDEAPRPPRTGRSHHE